MKQDEIRYIKVQIMPTSEIEEEQSLRTSSQKYRTAWVMVERRNINPTKPDTILITGIDPLGEEQYKVTFPVTKGTEVAGVILQLVQERSDDWFEKERLRVGKIVEERKTSKAKSTIS